MAGRRSNQTDVAVGQRIRTFRQNANLSQTELAVQIGVTFQQVQKYENGKNRVGAGRLMHIARALDVPITAFFDGLAKPSNKGQARAARIAELSSIPAARELLTAFLNISDDVLQAEIINLVRSLKTRKRRK
jgi:transcriptional regulator with XRE-family HTH domain